MQVVKPGGKLVVTLARDRFLKRYHFLTYYWDGRSRDDGIAPPGRYKLRVKLLGQERTPGPAGRDPPAPGAARARARAASPGAEGGSLSDFLAGAGVLLAAAAAAAAILLPAGRARSAAMLVALVLFPVLILGDQWHSPQIVDLRDDPARLAALGHRRRSRLSASSPPSSAAGRSLLPLAIVAALPFRVPLHAGGDTANLLVPLYLVIAGGVLATALGTGAGRGSPAGGAVGAARSSPAAPPRPRQDPPAWLPLAPRPRVVVLYALQTLYSPDFSKGAPERLLLLRAVLAGLRAAARRRVGPEAADAGAAGSSRVEAVAFVVVGSVEYLSREPVLERPGDPLERIPHLLPGQLGLLGPEHLRPLPGAGDRGRDGGAALGEGTARRWRC